MFALADLNKFYASIIRSFKPELEGEPIVVLSNNDWFSICQTKEAEALGIKMGTPITDFQHLIDKNIIHVFSTNFPLIADMSLRLKSLMRRYFIRAEDYSIDEMFLDISECPPHQYRKIALELVDIVLKGLGLPLSIGIAPTLSLTKIACKFAKKYPEFQGVYIIDNEEKRIEALKHTKVEDVWGIGKEYTKLLNSIGIKTAYQFTQKTKAWVRQNMTVVGERLWLDLQGIPTIDMVIEEADKKSVTVSRGFGTILKDYCAVSEAVSQYTCMAASKLRSQNLVTDKIIIWAEPVRSRFDNDHENHIPSIRVQLPVGTNFDMELNRYALAGFKRIFVPGTMYRKVGVIMENLKKDNPLQASIFDNVNRPKLRRVQYQKDYLNNIYGRDTVRLLSQGYSNIYKIKQEKLCPCYTTRINDFPVAV